MHAFILTWFSKTTAIERLRLHNCHFEQSLTFGSNRFTIGKSSKLAVLNAQVDLNTDKVTILRQKELYAI
jgi:hypothetical protein